MHQTPDIPHLVNQPGLFSSENGIHITLSRPNYAEGQLDVSSSSLNLHGTVHGGCLYTLADCVAGTAAIAHTGKRGVTVNSSMEFLRPATGSVITCTATPKKAGRMLCVMQVELRDEKQELVATGTFTFYLFEPKTD